MSFAAMAARHSPSNSRIRSGKRALNGGKRRLLFPPFTSSEISRKPRTSAACSIFSSAQSKLLTRKSRRVDFIFLFISRRITRPLRRSRNRFSKCRTKSSARSSTAIPLSLVIRKTPEAVISKSGYIIGAKVRRTSSTKTMSLPFPPDFISIMRGTLCGTVIKPKSGSRSAFSRLSTMPKPRFEINGTGCAGSTERGVKSGRIFVSNIARKSLACLSDKDDTGSTFILEAESSSCNLRQQLFCRATILPARRLIFTSCFDGRCAAKFFCSMPARTCSRRPATRTI